MATLDVSYSALLPLFGDFEMKGQKERRAFLAWFLQHYYRLDATEVDDAICDENGDRGIDGIYVSELRQQIDVFQSRMGKTEPLKFLGDPDLREMVGTLSQFKTAESVKRMIADTWSADLKNLLIRAKVVEYLEQGYQVRGVFVTNKARSQDAIDFLATTPEILLYDGLELAREYLPIDKPTPIDAPITFNVSGVDVIRIKIEEGVEMIMAPLLASELVTMGGIKNQEIFAWNLRYSLGKSPVNKEIERSILTPSEHKYFPAFHNGLTILAEDLSGGSGLITISKYAVVNGCQSLSALYQRAASITPSLRILTKFVSVSPSSPLALKITDHTNRQNGITGRDLQSNNPIQTLLQTQIHRDFGGAVHYRLARGERLDWDSPSVIENDHAARILLAFDLKEPESCHQNYKLFDEYHAKIFGRKEVDSYRIVALHDIDKQIAEDLLIFENKLFGSYSLTRFLFHYLLREVLELPESGAKEFYRHPKEYITQDGGRSKLRAAVSPVVKSLVNMMDAYLKKQSTNFDYKKDLKSPNKIADIRSWVIPLYQMGVQSKMTRPFTDLWNECGGAAPKPSPQEDLFAAT